MTPMVDRINNINPQRVAWCLRDLGVTPEQASVDTGLPLERITGALEGRPSLTFAQLRMLASYLGRSVMFFLEAEPVRAEQVHSPQFRTLAGQKPDLSRRVRQLVQRAERQRSIYSDLMTEAEGANVAPFEPPPHTNDPAIAARRARAWLGLGDTNNFESYRRAVEDRGILVFRTNGYAGKWQIAPESPVLGFSLYDPVLPVIVVKKQEAEVRQSFTLMHELGHVLLHRTSSVDDEGDMHAANGMEREANQFAGHLLVPTEFLERIDDATRPQEVERLEEWLQPNRRAWGVSTEVILLRLLSVGRLDQATYEHYRAWNHQQPRVEGEGGSRAYRYREPRHLFGDRFVRTVLGALNARQITLSKASDYLDGLKVTDLHKLERFYAGV